MPTAWATDNDVNTHLGCALQNDVVISLTRQFPTMTDRGQDTTILAMSVTGKATINLAILAKQWDIPLRTAQQTIRKTTQRSIRTVLNPALSQRF